MPWGFCTGAGLLDDRHVKVQQQAAASHDRFGQSGRGRFKAELGKRRQTRPQESIKEEKTLFPGLHMILAERAPARSSDRGRDGAPALGDPCLVKSVLETHHPIALVGRHGSTGRQTLFIQAVFLQCPHCFAPGVGFAFPEKPKPLGSRKLNQEAAPVNLRRGVSPAIH